jgi:hypothetical protein
VSDPKQQPAALRVDRSHFPADEAHLGARNARQHLPRPDRIERGHARIEKDRNLTRFCAVHFCFDVSCAFALFGSFLFAS